MKQIRSGVFETNSSSVHALVVPSKEDKPKCIDTLYFYIGEYGWETEEYNLYSYIWTYVCCAFANNQEEREKFKDRCYSLLVPKYVKELYFEEPLITFYSDSRYAYLENGYIDHSGCVNDFYDKIMGDDDLFIKAMINGKVYTSNDNKEEYGFPDFDKENNFVYFKYN